jgi:hypothetical protein
LGAVFVPGHGGDVQGLSYYPEIRSRNGSAPAAGAVFRAPAENTLRGEFSNPSPNGHAPDAGREGASRNARGGRDPRNFGIRDYSAAAIGRHLRMDAVSLSAARQQLIHADLLAYRKPLSQVLALPDGSPPATAPSAPRSGQVQSGAAVLRRVLEGGAQ